MSEHVTNGAAVLTLAGLVVSVAFGGVAFWITDSMTCGCLTILAGLAGTMYYTTRR